MGWALSALKAGSTEDAGAGRIPADVLDGRGQPRPTDRDHHSFCALGSLIKWVLQHLDPSPGKRRHIKSTPGSPVAGEREQTEQPNQPLLSDHNVAGPRTC